MAPAGIGQISLEAAEVQGVEPNPGGLRIEIADGPEIGFEAMKRDRAAGRPLFVLRHCELKDGVVFYERLRINQKDEVPQENGTAEESRGKRRSTRRPRSAQDAINTSGGR